MEFRVQNVSYFNSSEELEGWLKPWGEDGWTIAAMNDKYIVMQRPPAEIAEIDSVWEAITNNAG